MNEVRKRKLSSSEDQHNGKRYYVVLESEPEVHSDSDCDSVRSIQSAETAIAADTSDTCTKSSASEPELSPASLSEASDWDGSSGSTSSFVSMNGPAFIDIVINVEDDCWADVSLNSDSNSFHHDTEIPKADYWQCGRCGGEKNKPVFRYCEKCWQLRKEETLPRPKPKRKKNRWKSHHNRQQQTSKLDQAGPSGAVPEPSSQETLVSVSSHSSQDSGLSDGQAVELCNGCQTEQINAAFYHTTFGHMWGCYKCSKKAWKPHRRCPICNGQSRVIRLFK